MPSATMDAGGEEGTGAGGPATAVSLDVPVDLIKDPRAWTVEDIGVWLRWLGIGEHAEAFAARGVDGLALLQLSSEEVHVESPWAEFGVVDPDQQRVLESAVEPLRTFRDAEGAETGLALHAIEGPVAGEVFFVGAGGITGGRHSASNGVVLSENYVSRRHFQITRDRSGQHLLQDVGSTTGTFLMVREELLLEHLMVLQLGTTELTVQLEGELCALVATEGPDKDARADVPLEGIFVGRETSNGLCIRDPQISAFHCEVRYSDEHGGFVLDDKYSTNRTWLRLAPDGQPSKRYPLGPGDLFKVGSTLFHVVDPATIAGEQPPPGLLVGLPGPQLGATGLRSAAVAAAGGALTPAAIAPARSAGTESVASGEEADNEELDDGEDPYASARGGHAPAGGALASGRAASSASSASGAEAPPGPQLRWEPLREGEAKPVLPPEEYARRLTASRRRMQALHAETFARRSWPPGAGELQLSQDAGMYLMRERELSSLQQHMRNSRAQNAYQQQRPVEREEDLCKICYDREMEVVLLPCGHLVLCSLCAQKVSDCPVCRRTITNTIRTYKA